MLRAHTPSHLRIDQSRLRLNTPITLANIFGDRDKAILWAASKYPTDSGFALKGWKKCEIKNVGIVITGNAAMTQGNVVITDSTNKITTVDKTWGFIKDDKGALRIVLHHSSLPYQPN